ncbi:MAG: AI-2E family transporter [Alphaproteobacteria bacterium]|nr:AI-2E family transporter [Alphaproteobacteria bacterium]
MTLRRQAWIWLASLAAFILVLYFFRGILLPFVAGMLVAYFLDPLVDRVESLGLSRTLATSVITALFFVIVITTAVVLFPIAQRQLIGLMDQVPRLVELLEAALGPTIRDLIERVVGDDPRQVGLTATGFAASAVAWLGKVLGGIWSSGLALFNLVSLVSIAPVIAFYLLRDYDHMVARIDGWLPRHHAPVIREQLRLVDRAVAGFVRGQASVCLVLGAFYAVALSLIGLDFGFVIGLAGGALNFVPYVGTILTLALALGFALLQFWPEPTPIIAVAGVFVAGSLLDGMVLTPRLVGDRVGLHPVWVIFALLGGGALFGFLGVLIAVPVAAILGVLVRFALGRYLAGPLYRGRP